MDGEIIEGASGHTTTRMSGRSDARMQVVARVSGRRAWTPEQKLAILRDAFGPGGSVRSAIERHEISSGMLYTWRKNAMSGQLGVVRAAPQQFVQVRVEDTPLLPLPTVVPTQPSHIGIELPSGVKLSIDGVVDVEALGRILSVLDR